MNALVDDDAWYAGRPGVRHRFWHNQPVRITSGDKVGERGALISIEAMEPEPEYLVELGSGHGDVVVPESRSAAVE